MLGIAILIGPDLIGLGRSPLGPLLMIGAAICWAAGIVVIKGEVWPIGVFALTGWQLVMGGIPIVLAWLVLEPDPDLSRLTWTGILATLYAATVALIFCFAAHNKVVTMLPATVAAISTLAIPVVGLLSSAWLLGEPVGLARARGPGSGPRRRWRWSCCRSEPCRQRCARLTRDASAHNGQRI